QRTAIDEPEGASQSCRRQSRHQERERGGPQLLVDWHPRGKQFACRDQDESTSHKLHEPLSWRPLALHEELSRQHAEHDRGYRGQDGSHSIGIEGRAVPPEAAEHDLVEMTWEVAARGE